MSRDIFRGAPPWFQQLLGFDCILIACAFGACRAEGSAAGLRWVPAAETRVARGLACGYSTVKDRVLLLRLEDSAGAVEYVACGGGSG